MDDHNREEREAAWAEHLKTKRSSRQARKSSFDAGWDAALAVFEQAHTVQDTEESEWEYAWEADEEVRTTTRPRGPRILFDGVLYPPETLALFARGRRVRRRKAGPWEAVEQGDAS